MKKMFVLLSISSLMFACQNHHPEAGDDGYEKVKENLREKESKNPGRFLSVSSKDKHNLIGQTVIKATIMNNAKVCTFKDVEIELSFFSKTSVLLEKDNETIYEKIPPGETASFKTKYFAPKGTDSVAIKVLNAKIS